MNNPCEKKIQLCVRGPFTSVPRLPRVLLGAALILVFSIGTASSFGPQMPEIDYAKAHKHIKNPLLSVSHACRSLLNPTHTSSTAPTDNNQRNAGKIVALGVLFGARFALEPKKHDTSTNVQQVALSDKDVSAGSIIRYRKCLKKEALAVLSEQSDKEKQL